MRIFMACPAPPRSRKGNRVTAVRWAEFLQGLGHRLTIAKEYDERDYDLLIALHARRSYPAVRGFRRWFPGRPVVVALTGTDLYRDIQHSSRARRSLELADRLIVLQEKGIEQVPAEFRSKVRVIYQSAPAMVKRGQPDRRFFDVCVLGHLRHEKDPFRTALALEHLPTESRIRVIHAGKALSVAMEERGRRLMERQPRYRWIGEVSGSRARHILASSRLMVLSSRMEGGSNVVSEALADGVPILASRISGTVGQLGDDYPGLYPVGDTRALADLLIRAETETAFLAQLERCCRRLAPLVRPERERLAWKRLLAELCGQVIGTGRRVRSDDRR